VVHGQPEGFSETPPPAVSIRSAVNSTATSPATVPLHRTTSAAVAVRFNESTELAPKWRYHHAMPSVQVKDVPTDVHAVLRRRAAAAGQSLQEYLLGRLTADARRPTLDELLMRAEGRAGGSTPLGDATRLVRSDRDAA
jgi:hypothetical protein